jgi:hypothetical protein
LLHPLSSSLLSIGIGYLQSNPGRHSLAIKPHFASLTHLHQWSPNQEGILQHQR